MRTLATTFRKNGFDYEQVERTGDVAIYRQTKAGQPQNIHFEVGRIRSNAARDQFGQHFEACESWPSSEEWGVRGFTYFTFEEAKKKAANLNPAQE